MERYLPSDSKIDIGRYHYKYRITLDFLTSRRRMVLSYAGTKLFLGIISSLCLIKIGLEGFRFKMDSNLFFIGAVMLGVGFTNMLQSVIRFLLVYCDDLQGKFIKREHHKSSQRYLDEDECYVYYFKVKMIPEEHYDVIRIPQGIDKEARKTILEQGLYKRLKRYTHSIRYQHFSPEMKQCCLAAISEIMEELVARNYPS